MQQLLTLVDMSVYVVYAYFGCVNVGYLKFRFRLIRTKIKLRKSGSNSGFLKPCSGRPLCMGNEIALLFKDPVPESLHHQVPC